MLLLFANLLTLLLFKDLLFIMNLACSMGMRHERAEKGKWMVE